jgi:hypothetical protein
VRLWSCEQSCSKDAGATRVQTVQRITPGPASRRGIFVHSNAASSGGLHGNLEACADGENKDEGRTVEAMRHAASKTRKGRRESDSEPGWEKTAHDLAKQRDALRAGETRPPPKRADGDRFQKLVNLLLRQLVVSPASSPFAPSTSTLTVERLCVCRKRNRQ